MWVSSGSCCGFVVLWLVELWLVVLWLVVLWLVELFVQRGNPNIGYGVQSPEELLVLPCLVVLPSFLPCLSFLAWLSFLPSLLGCPSFLVLSHTRSFLTLSPSSHYLLPHTISFLFDDLFVDRMSHLSSSICLRPLSSSICRRPLLHLLHCFSICFSISNT